MWIWGVITILFEKTWPVKLIHISYRTTFYSFLSICRLTDIVSTLISKQWGQRSHYVNASPHCTYCELCYIYSGLHVRRPQKAFIFAGGIRSYIIRVSQNWGFLPNSKINVSHNKFQGYLPKKSLKKIFKIFEWCLGVPFSVKVLLHKSSIWD